MPHMLHHHPSKEAFHQVSMPPQQSKLRKLSNGSYSSHASKHHPVKGAVTTKHNDSRHTGVHESQSRGQLSKQESTDSDDLDRSEHGSIIVVREDSDDEVESITKVTAAKKRPVVHYNAEEQTHRHATLADALDDEKFA
jgi:hypothetical protein